MITFVIALIVLVLGYVFYGKFIERLFGLIPIVMCLPRAWPTALTI